MSFGSRASKLRWLCKTMDRLVQLRIPHAHEQQYFTEFLDCLAHCARRLDRQSSVGDEEAEQSTTSEFAAPSQILCGGLYIEINHDNNGHKLSASTLC